MLIMANEKITDILQRLGQRLKEARLSRDETQETFAARLGLSRQSLAKMEKGEGSVPLQNWLAASDILDCLDTWQDVLHEKDDLFQQFETTQKARKRASGKRR
jgi:DNA-binding XRE family transcriptional regulator